MFSKVWLSLCAVVLLSIGGCKRHLTKEAELHKYSEFHVENQPCIGSLPVDIQGYDETPKVYRCVNGKYVEVTEDPAEKARVAAELKEYRRKRIETENHRVALVDAAATRILTPKELHEFLRTGPSVLVSSDNWNGEWRDLIPQYNGLLLLQFQMKLAANQAEHTQ